MIKSHLTMYAAIEYLLTDLCVDWGFCIPPKDAERLKEMKSLEADDFAHLVLIAEGMVPEYEKQWCRKISGRFKDYFDQDEVAESEFRSAN